MKAFLIITKYKNRNIPFAFLSMALFHIPLFFNKKVYFYKLMGCGKNGTFDIHPDFNQWAIMVFFPSENSESEQPNPDSSGGTFIRCWWRVFKVTISWFLLEPYAGHGTWDGKSFVSQRKSGEEPSGKIGVLTRATIRLSKLGQFWRAVPNASKDLSQTQGLLYSVGIGEIPFVKQATFSLWESMTDMKAFAYKKRAHQEVIQQTRDGNWYSEEMFLRFKILAEKV
jgi:hypothetical protein